MNSPKFIAMGACIGVLAVAVSACGSSDDTSSDGSSSTPTGLSGSLRIDGSSTVGPLTQAVAEQFNSENPDVEVSVGESGTGGGFEKFCAGETVINDASRPIEPEEDSALQEGRHQLRGGSGRQRRADGRSQQREPGHLPDGRSARPDLDAGRPGQQLVRRHRPRPAVRRGHRALRPGHRLRHVRLLHRSGQRRGGRPDQGLQQRRRGRQPDGHRRRGLRGRHRLLRLLLLQGERGQPEGRRDRRR